MIYEILIQGGIGDLITYLAKLDSLLKPGDQAKFCFTGGFETSVELQKEILRCDPRVTEQGKIDKVLDWRPDYAAFGFPFRLPFSVYTSDEAKEFARDFLKHHKLDPSKTIVIQPRTTEGNIRGFEPERHWEDWKWQRLIALLSESGYSVIQVGSVKDAFHLNGVWNLVGKTSILETIALIQKAGFTIGINSWVWEIAAYALKPTICLYFHNHFWIPLHVPENLENLKLFKEREAQPEEVFEAFLKLSGAS